MSSVTLLFLSLRAVLSHTTPNELTNLSFHSRQRFIKSRMHLVGVVRAPVLALRARTPQLVREDIDASVWNGDRDVYRCGTAEPDDLPACVEVLMQGFYKVRLAHYCNPDACLLPAYVLCRTF